jgi:hypothetical protein
LLSGGFSAVFYGHLPFFTIRRILLTAIGQKIQSIRGSSFSFEDAQADAF